MKKIKKIVFLITVGMIMIFTNGCNQDVNVTAQNPQQNEKNEDDQNDVNQDDDTNKDPEQNDYYNIDYSNSPIFNKTSKNISISKNGDWTGIWLEAFDATEYEYLYFEYENASDNFTMGVQYDGSFDTDFCKAGNGSAYLKLNTSKKAKIPQVFFTSIYSEAAINKPSNDTTVTPVKMIFTKSVELPSKVHDSAVAGNINTSISSLKFAENMKIGWNLGNSLEAWTGPHNNASEYAWGEPYTTKEIVELGKNNGYSTIRIPVTWFNHIIDDEYTIDPRWMARVKEVVDWAINAGYYVIINEHHSTNENLSSPVGKGQGWMVTNNADDIAESKRFLEAVWKQITEAFNNSYDEHLIFETINEPRDEFHPDCQYYPNCPNHPYYAHHHTWNPCEDDAENCSICIRDFEVLNEYNQLILDTIRKSGGNNANRFVMIPGLATNSVSPTISYFKMPNDTATDKLMLTIHNYIMGGGESEYNPKKYSLDLENQLIGIFSALNEKFVKSGIPVVVGEAGVPLSVDKSERIKWAASFAKLASSYGMPVICWEVASIDLGTMQMIGFGNLDRWNLKLREPDFSESLMSNWNLNNVQIENEKKVNFNLYETAYKNLLNVAITDTGNNYRVKKFLEKLKSGNTVYISAIGGSITQGVGAEPETKGYAHILGDKIAEAFGIDKNNITFKCAGIAGTPSTLGLIRYDDDVTKGLGNTPDLVVVDFAVNDGVEDIYNQSYEALIRKILSENEEIAVIPVYSAKPDFYSQEAKIATAEFYGLPSLSIMDGYTGAIKGKLFTAEDYFYSEAYLIHPNNKGHEYMADCITNLLKVMDSESVDSKVSIPAGYKYSGKFDGFKRISQNDDYVTITEGSFDKTDIYYDTPYSFCKDKNWANDGSNGNQSFKMNINCKTLLMSYKKLGSWENFDFGSIDVFVDGTKLGTYDGSKAAGGWNNLETVVLVNESTAANHEIEIKMAKGYENYGFTISAFGYSR